MAVYEKLGPEERSIFASMEHRSKGVTKPCRMLGYCPYGVLVMLYPLNKDHAELYAVAISLDMFCRVYDHICPVFLEAEFHVDTKR